MDKAGVIYHVDIPCEAEKINKKKTTQEKPKKQQSTGCMMKKQIAQRLRVLTRPQTGLNK